MFVEGVARLIDLADPLDADAGVVEFDGSVDDKIVEVAAASPCSTSVTCDNVANAALVVDGTGTVELVSGEAQITVPGGEEGDLYCVLTDGAGEGLDDEQEAGSFAVASHRAIRLSDATPVPTSAAFVDASDRFVTVFDDATTSVDRQVAAATGIASELSTSPANRRDEITAEVEGTTITVPGSVTITWYLAAAGPTPATGAGVDYLGRIERVEDDWPVIDTGVPGGVAPTGEGPFLRIDYGDADDEYELNGTSTTVATFRTTITAGVDGAVGRVLDPTTATEPRRATRRCSTCGTRRPSPSRWLAGRD